MNFLKNASLVLFLVMLLVGLGACSKQQAETIPAHEVFTIHSSETDETRFIAIYFPPDYQLNSTATYPVLYMPDGGVREDFPHIATTIDTAIKAGEMRPVILVGVENTERRRDMTPVTEVAKDREVAPVVGKSAAFRAFFANELIPYINEHYRVNGDAGIIGESLAALFVVEIFLLQPELFDKYIALSPSLWWNNQNLVQHANSLVNKHPEMDIDLYLSSANEEDIFPHAAQIFENLSSDIPAGLRVEYEPRPDLRHNNIYRSVSPSVLRKMYPPIQ